MLSVVKGTSSVTKEYFRLMEVTLYWHLWHVVDYHRKRLMEHNYIFFFFFFAPQYIQMQTFQCHIFFRFPKVTVLNYVQAIWHDCSKYGGWVHLMFHHAISSCWNPRYSLVCWKVHLIAFSLFLISKLETFYCNLKWNRRNVWEVRSMGLFLL